MLEGFPDKKCSAVCTIGFAEKPGFVRLFHGKTNGTLVLPRGYNGFGWDRCFLPEGFTETYAEMLPDTKNLISHRYKAVLKLKSYFESLIF